VEHLTGDSGGGGGLLLLKSCSGPLHFLSSCCSLVPLSTFGRAGESPATQRTWFIVFKGEENLRMGECISQLGLISEFKEERVYSG
jgi:hypothetical protein